MIIPTGTLSQLVEFANEITTNCGNIEEHRHKLFCERSKEYDAIFGLAIADALGVPYEFEERGSFNCTDMVGYGSHDQPAGTWSDDTSMTIATAKAIHSGCSEIDISEIRDNFMDWLNTAEYTANGDVFDVGHTTLKALVTGEPRMGEYENGNGSLMRILPLAFTYCTDDEVRSVSAITHAHWISTEACVIYVNIARRLKDGAKLETVLGEMHFEEPFNRLSILKDLDEKDIKSSGYVVDTLEAALWALVHSNSYEEAVLKAINLGEDTDTVGAVTGGLAGIIYGLESETCQKWYKELRGKEVIMECIR